MFVRDFVCVSVCVCVWVRACKCATERTSLRRRDVMNRG